MDSFLLMRSMDFFEQTPGVAMFGVAGYRADGLRPYASELV